jgi:two-component system chemotaxis response regulator CheY
MTDQEGNFIDFLIVDDAACIPPLVRAVLKGYGYTSFRFASNGQEALRIFRKSRVKCIIADYCMPQLSGIELLHAIRNDPERFTTPFVMLTGNSTPEAVVYALEEGVDGYVVKPFTAKNLLSSVNNAIARRSKLDPFQKKVIEVTRLKLQKRYKDALDLGNEVLKEKPDADVLLSIGECLDATGRSAEAIEILQGPELAKRHARAKSLLGKIYLEQGDDKRAIACFEEAAEASPLSLDKKVDLAGAYLKSKLNEEAEALIDSIMKSDPTNLVVTSIGRLYLENGDLEKASLYLKVQAVPTADTVHIFNNYAVSLRRGGRCAECEEVYKRCADILPDSYIVQFNMGVLYLQMKDHVRARRAMEKALKLNPDLRPARECLESLGCTSMS